MQREKRMQARNWAIVLCLAIPLAATAQVPANPDPDAPDFRMVVQGTFDPETLVEFNRRVQDYAALRSRLEVGLPPLVVTTNADDIESFERRLTERLRHARGSRRGQLFIPAMEGQLKRMMGARADPVTVAAIMDDNPGEFDVDVNETYKKKYALGTMPPKLLLLLPDLAPDLQYRFVGRHLIVYDVRANMIVDEIPFALQCRDCVPEREEDHDDDHETPAPR
jgi:hypothetical protein